MNRPAEAIPLLRQSLTMDPASDARRTSIVTALRQRANLLWDGEGPNEAVVLEREAAALTAGRRCSDARPRARCRRSTTG
jgi:hypothetical protein